MMILCIPERRRGHRFGERLAGAERGSRLSQVILHRRCERMRASEDAPCDPFRLLERRHGLAEIVKRGAVVLAEHIRIQRPQLERETNRLQFRVS